ncbi:hypothetical protein ACFFRR_003332 [Megaselia abdita]
MKLLSGTICSILLHVLIRGTFGGDVGGCVMDITLTSKLNSCYNLKNIIPLTWTTDCIPINIEYVIQACTNPSDTETCFTIDTIPSYRTSYDVQIDSRFSIGTTYYITIATTCGSASETTYPFLVDEPNIEIISVTKSCYDYKSILVIDFEISCFPPGIYIPIYACTNEAKDYKERCVQIGTASSDESSVEISLTAPFLLKESYYILLTYEVNYATITARSGTFMIKEKCKCEPGIAISTSVADHYNPKDIITLKFYATCLPINYDLIVKACTSAKDCFDITTVASTTNSIDVLIGKPFYSGVEYCLVVETKYGELRSQTGVFVINDPTLTITSKLKYCYSINEIIEVAYTGVCLGFGTEIQANVCNVKTGECLPLGIVFNEINGCFYVKLEEPEFQDGYSYYITLEANYGKTTTQSSNFSIGCTVDIDTPTQ